MPVDILKKDKTYDKMVSERIKAIRQQLGSEHPEVIHYMLYLAQLHIDQERYEEAEELFIKAFDGRRLKLGDTHPHTLESLNNLINLYEAWNKPEEAEKWRVKLTQTEPMIE